jgi:hypothetical protein
MKVWKAHLPALIMIDVPGTTSRIDFWMRIWLLSMIDLDGNSLCMEGKQAGKDCNRVGWMRSPTAGNGQQHTMEQARYKRMPVIISPPFAKRQSDDPNQK